MSVFLLQLRIKVRVFHGIKCNFYVKIHHDASWVAYSSLLPDNLAGLRNGKNGNEKAGALRKRGRGKTEREDMGGHTRGRLH